MKKEDIIALGINGETAAKILSIHETELTAEKGKTSEVQKELEASKATVKDITAKLKTYDGVDVEKLKADAAAWEKKYNEDMSAVKIDSALDLALTKAGAKDVSLAKHLIDRRIIKSEDGKLIGLTEQLDRIKAEKSWLFGEDKPPEAQLPDVSTGMKHSEPPSKPAPATLAAALAEKFN